MRFYFLILIFICVCPFRALYAATYTPNGDIIGEISHYKVKKNDDLRRIARQFDVGIVELLAANPGVMQRTLKAGMNLTIPTAYILPYVRNGIVLNLSAMRLFYFPDAHTVMTFPLGIGREGWETPIGSTVIALKRKNPVWIPPESIREEEPNLPEVVPAGPNNPLGQYALNLGMPGIRIHGTNSPYSIGKRTSHGCIRMYPEDIKTLFNAVAKGTSVVIIDSSYQLGWQGNTLFLQIMLTAEQADVLAKYMTPVPEDMPEVEDAILKETADHAISVDWQAVKEIIAEHKGIPLPVGRRYLIAVKHKLF